MEIPKEFAVQYLGSEKFCTKKEALESAEYNNDADVWIAVFDREDFSIENILSCAEKIDDEEVWDFVLSLEKITPDVAVFYAKKYADRPEVWENILKREDVFNYFIN